MSFPPSDVIQAEMTFYRLSAIAHGVSKAIAGTGLTAEVGHTPSLLQYVKVPLKASGAVMLAANTRYPGAWMIASPQTTTSGEHDLAWPLDIEDDVVVRIFSAVVRKALVGRDLPSPYRWGRVGSSPIVDLADQLMISGVSRAALHLPPLRTLDDEGRPRAASVGLNELRLTDKSDPDRTLVIRSDPQHGWSVDQVMARTGGSGRLNLAAPLGLTPALPRVGFGEVDLSRMARLLVEDTFWADVPDDDQRQLTRYAPTPREEWVYSRDSAERAAIAWLRWAGFVDPADRWARRATLTPHVQLHVDYSEKQVGVGGVQRYKGISAASGRTAVVIARSGFSKNARAWADTADMLLFRIQEDGLMSPDNELAYAYTPVDVGHRPRDCDDSACRTLGCVLDDDACPTGWGTYSDPDAERLRL